MKKFLAILLALTMVFALVACGTTETPGGRAHGGPGGGARPRSRRKNPLRSPQKNR